jgi:hypothetical protein
VLNRITDATSVEAKELSGLCTTDQSIWCGARKRHIFFHAVCLASGAIFYYLLLCAVLLFNIYSHEPTLVGMLTDFNDVIVVV